MCSNLPDFVWCGWFSKQTSRLRQITLKLYLKWSFETVLAISPLKADRDFWPKNLFAKFRWNRSMRLVDIVVTHTRSYTNILLVHPMETVLYVAASIQSKYLAAVLKCSDDELSLKFTRLRGSDIGKCLILLRLSASDPL